MRWEPRSLCVWPGWLHSDPTLAAYQRSGVVVVLLALRLYGFISDSVVLLRELYAFVRVCACVWYVAG